MVEGRQDTQANPALRATMKAVAWHALVPVALLALLVGVVPKFKEIFKSFGTPLPTLTMIVLDVSDFTRSWFIVPLLIVAASLTLDGLVYYRLRRTGNPIHYRLWSLLVGLIEAAALFALIDALSWPAGVLFTAK